MSERWTFNGVEASAAFDVAADFEKSRRAVERALTAGPEVVDRLRQAALEGVVIENAGPERLAEAMVETTTEFDFAPGHEWSLPDDLRERLLRWCADLQAWDRATRP